MPVSLGSAPQIVNNKCTCNEFVANRFTLPITWLFNADYGNNIGTGLYFQGTYMTDRTVQNIARIEQSGYGNVNRQLNFTGQHRCFTDFVVSLEQHEGLLCSSTGCYRNLDYVEQPCINEALPVLELTRKPEDSTCFGVISGREDADQYNMSVGSFVSFYAKTDQKDNPVLVNSLGEGGMWVCDLSGPLANGDFVTSSSVPGYGMKQGDDIRRACTVAKMTCDCDFEDMPRPRTRLLTQEVSMGFKAEWVNEEVQEALPRTFVEFDASQHRYVQRTTNFSTRQQVMEEFDLYDDHGNIIGKHSAPKSALVERTCTFVPKDPVTGCLRCEPLLQADGTPTLGTRFRTRYLAPNGNVLTEAEYEGLLQAGQPAHKACFVGCVYQF